MTFAELGLHDALLRAVSEKNYTTPSPIQQQAIPVTRLTDKVKKPKKPKKPKSPAL